MTAAPKFSNPKWHLTTDCPPVLTAPRTSRWQLLLDVQPQRGTTERSRAEQMAIAAPELYEALTNLLDAFDSLPRVPGPYGTNARACAEIARAALAKVTP